MMHHLYFKGNANEMILSVSWLYTNENLPVNIIFYLIDYSSITFTLSYSLQHWQRDQPYDIHQGLDVNVGTGDS